MKRIALICALLVHAAPAAAQSETEWLSFFSVRGELGVGGMLPEYQLSSLEYGFGLVGAVRLGVRPIEPLVIQAGYESWWFPSDAGDGQQHTVSGGLRIEPLIEDLLWIIGDANAGVAITGPKVRFGISISLGLEFAIERVLGIGAFVRWGHTFADPGEDYPSDASMIMAGLSLTVRGGTTQSGGDRDRDRVMDADDVCPDVPQGDTPDPARRGCPLGDADGDGVPDREDVCPEVAQGDNPDRQRRGCPAGDRDGDGVLDREDICPEVPQGATPDPMRRGCPAADTDGDRVLDHEDACPTVPAGDHPDPTRRGCPELDRDGDGIGDGRDQCPDMHQGLRPDPERLGCPLPDRDADTVPDRDDTCPDEFGSPSSNPRRNGCPGLVRVEGGQIRILRPVFFATNRDTILARSRPVLTAVADALIATPSIRRISIEGHTDDVGDDAFNMDLSQRRAQTVMAFLIEHGVEASRIEHHGFGETQPLVPGTTTQARAVNRRVEFRIIDPPASDAEAP